MPYQGGQRSAKRTPAANWTPTFPGANLLFGKGMFAGRGANAATTQPQIQSTPFDLAPVGTPFVKGGILGYKGPDNQWMPRGDLDAPTQTQVPAVIPAGTVQPNAVVSGLTPAGTVDRSQGDEYKSQMAQYQNLIKQQKAAEAEDLGMKIWMEKYGKTPMGQAGGFIGAKNPLLAATFPETGGYASTFAPVEDYQMGEFGTRAQGDTGYTMESLNPLQAQAQQQAATAAQADKATTVKLPIRNRVQAFLYGGM